MSLIDLFGENKVDVAIERLKTFEPPEGYYLAFSGGKDSVTVKALADMAGVKYDAHYNLTTVDPPELVHFIKREHPDVAIDKPLKTMWQLIVEHGVPPLRHQRYCCAELKERGGEGRVCITGIRQQESVKRSKRKMVESCQHNTDKCNPKIYVNPIIDWSEHEVWEFIRKYNIPYCSLYDEGWRRLGCVCCPNGNQQKQAERWPKIAEGYKRACIRAFNRSMERRKGRNYEAYITGKGATSGEELYEWWISGTGSHNQEDDQTVMFE